MNNNLAAPKPSVKGFPSTNATGKYAGAVFDFRRGFQDRYRSTRNLCDWLSAMAEHGYRLRVTHRFGDDELLVIMAKVEPKAKAMDSAEASGSETREKQ